MSCSTHVDCAAKQLPITTYYGPKSKSLVSNPVLPSPNPEAHTFEVLKSIADDFSSMLQWIIDIPSFHPLNCIPVLDLEIFKVKKDEVTQIIFKFYKKEVCRKTTITTGSALPAGDKKSILTAE